MFQVQQLLLKVRNVISSGGRPIAITDCLNYGNPEKPDVFFDFKEGVRGIGDAARSLSFIDGEALPIISGNVSFYNESKQGRAVIPSPVICVLGRVDHINQSKPMQVFESGLSLISIGKRYAEFGGTQIKKYVSEINNVAPQFRAEEEARQNKFVLDLIQSKQCEACHDISAGGLWMTLTEMVLGERANSKCGAELNLEGDVFTSLFSENGGYVIAVKPENEASI